MINQRQNGRRRGRGGQRQNGGGGRGPEMGNRIDNRARGNAAQLLEKYKTLARDAQQAGDRVLAEYYLQFADHYFRVLAESRARYEEANPQARREQRYDGESDGLDGEDGDGEDGDYEAAERPRDNRSQQQRGYRDDRGDRPERAPREDRYARDDRDERPARQERQPREDAAQREDMAPREDRYARDDRPRRDGGRERMGLRPRANGNGAAHRDDDIGEDALPFDALPPSISASMDPVPGIEGEPVTPAKRRGRPKKVVSEAAVEE